MPQTDTLRILTTNDFLGAFFPQRTSFGVLPGARALINTVDRLREGAAASVWIDVGDFAQGGVLAHISSGTMGFTAASHLPIDAAVAGNHEFDWGVQHLQRWARELPFPLLCANYEIDLPATTILHAGDWCIGVIGLTQPQLANYNRWARQPQAAVAPLVKQLAAGLRQQQVDTVVLAIHEGVEIDFFATTPPSMNPRRIISLLSELQGEVDAVLGGHTLGAWHGVVGEIPYVQPVPYGCEIGFVDLVRGQQPSIARVQVEPVDLIWSGPGYGVWQRLEKERVGSLREPLMSGITRTTSLAQAFANGLLKCTVADVALVFPGMSLTQPPLDGWFAYLSAGDVNEADILRMTPYVVQGSAGNALCCEVTQHEMHHLVSIASREEGSSQYTALYRDGWWPPAIAHRDAGKPIQTLIVDGAFHSELVTAWLGRDVQWVDAGINLRDALHAFVS
jgi:hypothetical protein